MNKTEASLFFNKKTSTSIWHYVKYVTCSVNYISISYSCSALLLSCWTTFVVTQVIRTKFRADSRLVPSQWETSLQNNAVSHWLGANLESALKFMMGYPALNFSTVISLAARLLLWLFWVGKKCVHTLVSRQNGRHFTDDNFNGIFLHENICTFIQISLKFVAKGPVYNKPSLVQIMAWRWKGSNPLFEPMMV